MEAALAKEGLTPEFLNAQVDHYMDYARAHPEVWTEGMGWYEREHELAMSIAASSNRGLTTDGAAAVLAADSPRTSVQTARDNAAATVLAVNEDGALTVTKEMVESRYRESLALAAKEPAAKQAGLRAAAGAQKAYALANELGAHDMLSGDASVISRWHESRTILPDNWEKGLRIARGEKPADVLSGAKVWSFYDNMRNPTESKSVTIDTWMLRGMSGKLTAKADELAKLLGSTKGQKSNGRYEVFSRRIYDGAVRYHTTPLQTQAIVWTAIQAEMSAARIKPKP